jgi:hypothetical protein
MALGIRKKSGKPQTQQAPPQAAAAPAAPAPSTVPPDWREQLTATKPKGRFTYGENIPGYRKK